MKWSKLTLRTHTSRLVVPSFKVVFMSQAALTKAREPALAELEEARRGAGKLNNTHDKKEVKYRGGGGGHL